MTTNTSRTRRTLALAAAAAVATLATVATAGGALAVTATPASGGGSGVTVLTPSITVDTAHERATLPLHLGVGPTGGAVWYVLTDTSSKAEAQASGLNYVPKLANALGSGAVQSVTRAADGTVTFTGGVDFSPTRNVVSGPAGMEFLGGRYTPGANGDGHYSPLITSGDGVVEDATQVANSTGQHDSIVSIDYTNRTVTLSSFFGFWNGHKTVYFHLDASDPKVAAAEGSNYAPLLDKSPGIGSDDPKTSARAAIIPVINGAVGATNPVRQGLNSAIRKEGDPDNINQEIPGQGNDRYSPVWDITLVNWNQSAIDAGKLKVLTSASDVASAFGAGQITGMGSTPNSSIGGFPASGAISNCPLFALAS